MSSEIETLLADHGFEIAKLRQSLADVIEPQYDDIWLLRYILSNKTAEEAEEPCRFSINWLKENRDIVERIRNGEPIPMANIISQFQVAGDHKFTSAGEPIFYVRIGLCNPKGLMDAVPFDDVLRYMTLSRIKTLAYCDAETRKRGKFVKAITVLDMNNVKFGRGQDSRFNKIIGDSSKLSEKLFPQLLGRSVAMNVPTFFAWTFNLMKPLMSKRAVEKFVMCPGIASGKTPTACPFLTSYLKLEDVPSFLGGGCNCSGGCIGGVSNSQTEPISGISEAGFTQVQVSARSEQSFDFPIECGSVLGYSFRSESKKCKFSLSCGDVKIIDCAKDSADGKWECPNTAGGNIVVKLDNSGSLIWAATVEFKFDIKSVQEAPVVSSKTV